MPLNPQALDLVTRTILGEANANDPASYQAVAHVIKNRLESQAWGPDTRVGPVIGASKQFAVWNKTGLPAYNPPAPGTNPSYDRAAAVAQAVFSGQLPDNTGGATHYYAPSGMPGGAPPDWAAGQTGRLIGSQYFYRLPLTASNTAGTAITSPSMVQSDADAGAARQYLASLSAHPTRAGDTANMNPAFASRLAAAIKQARAEGLPVTVFSGFREPGQTGSAYDAGGNSSHSYGLASDIGGLDGANGKITNRWAQIAQQNGLHNPYGVGDANEYNHWQLPELPLERSPEMLAQLKAARATGDWSKVWAAYSAPDASDARKAVGPWQPPPAEEVNPANLPAAQAQPMAATAPPGSPPIPGKGQNPSAGFVGPGSDKYTVVQGMTTGTSHNPQLTTAANWGNLFGRASPTPPASAPAAAEAPSPRPVPDLHQRVPLENTPLPPSRPQDGPAAAAPPPGALVNEPTGSPLSSIVPNWGATTPAGPSPVGSNPDPTSTARIPKATPGAPSMGFPAMQSPFPQLPGSMLSSAQNLIKLLFPSNVG